MIDEAALRDGLADLNSLAVEEYRQSLRNVADDANETRSAVRVGRLVGVLLKEPFAVPEPLDPPSARTAAYRSWQLVGAREFEAATRTTTWQYEVLGRIRAELVPEEPYLGALTPYEFAELAYHETGFFGFFARAVRKYICGDGEIRRNVEDGLKESSKAGAKVAVLTPEGIVGSGGAALGIYLVQAVPFLGIVGAPVIAGLVVILYKLGVESFCEWSNQLRTDEDEKH